MGVLVGTGVLVGGTVVGVGVGVGGIVGGGIVGVAPPVRSKLFALSKFPATSLLKKHICTMLSGGVSPVGGVV